MPDNGIGKGIDRMEKSRSGGERSSIGNIEANVESCEVRIGAIWDCTSAPRCLYAQ